MLLGDRVLCLSSPCARKRFRWVHRMYLQSLHNLKVNECKYRLLAHIEYLLIVLIIDPFLQLLRYFILVLPVWVLSHIIRVVIQSILQLVDIPRDYLEADDLQVGPLYLMVNGALLLQKLDELPLGLDRLAVFP